MRLGRVTLITYELPTNRTLSGHAAPQPSGALQDSVTSPEKFCWHMRRASHLDKIFHSKPSRVYKCAHPGCRCSRVCKLNAGLQA